MNGPAKQRIRKRRILLLLRNHGYLRNFESVICELSKRHVVIIGSRGPEKHMATNTVGHVKRLQVRFRRLEAHRFPKRRDRWARFAWSVRALRSYLRYLHPRYARAHKLKARARAKVTLRWLPLLERWFDNRPRALAVADGVLAGVERAIPADRALTAFVASHRPDLVVVSPLVDFGSTQTDYLKSARALGVPSALAVASWDNLTNKGLMHVQPDIVLVWNEWQRREAIELHSVPPGRVIATGAQLFDHWFERRPATTSHEFAARVGLPDDGALIVYVCSSLFIAEHEVPFVRRWLAAIRASSAPELRRSRVLIRPHPGHTRQWAGVDLGDCLVTIHPRAGALPLRSVDKNEYFDTLWHANAIVGINTSAMLEAAILGKRTYTIQDPEFVDTQRGTLHFDYLANGRILNIAGDLEEHCRQLASGLTSSRNDASEVRQFVQAFLRPHGLDRPATPLVVEALERVLRDPDHNDQRREAQ